MNETIAAIDRGYYDSLSRAIRKLDRVHKATARVIRMEIDMVNALTLIRAKKLGLRFQEIQNDLVGSGGVDRKGLQQIYDSAPKRRVGGSADKGRSTSGTRSRRTGGTGSC